MVAKEGRVGACIDICLEMSSGIQTPIEQPPPGRKSTESSTGRSSEEREGVQEDTTDLLGLDDEHGVAGIDLEGTGHGDRPERSGYVDLMS